MSARIARPSSRLAIRGRRVPTHSVSTHAGLVAAIVLVGVVLGLLLLGHSGLALKLSPFLLVVAILGATLQRAHHQRRFRALSPLTISFVVYVVMFALVPIADVAYSNASTYTSGYTYTSWLVVGGAASLAIGVIFAWQVWPWTYLPVEREPLDRTTTYWPYGRATVLAVLLLGVVYVFVGRTVGSASGAVHLVHDFALRRKFLHLTPLLGRVLSFVPAALALRAADVLRRPSRRRVLSLLFVWTPVCLLATGFYGDRFRPLSILVMTLAFVHFGFRRLSGAVVVTVAIVLFAIFVAVGIERNVVGTSGKAISLSGAGFYTNYVGRTHEYGQFRDFIVTVDGVPARIPFQYGRTLLAVIPGVPFATSADLISGTFYPTLYTAGTSIPTPLPGELYMNFGPLGVFIGLAAFGLGIGFLESYCARNWRRVDTVGIYALSLLHLPLILRGDSATFAGTYLIALITLIIGARLVRSSPQSHIRGLAMRFGPARHARRGGTTV